ncbi:MAG: 3-keto-disaccharide hydrolase [Aureliella sp.]
MQVTAQDEKPVKEPPVKDGWRPLIKANSLDGWEITQFGGEGEVKVVDGQLVLGMGDPLTGITWKAKDFPTTNFEIKLEAQRIQGNDFLCGLTFPIGEDHASLICGGWGGGVVGLSSVDGNDASENSTSTFLDFKNGQWYSFRVRVDDQFVTAWVDDERVFRQERDGRDFSVRAEVMSTRPLGFCVFQSKVAVRNLAWRPLESGKTKGDAKPAADAKQDTQAEAKSKSSS